MLRDLRTWVFWNRRRMAGAIVGVLVLLAVIIRAASAATGAAAAPDQSGGGGASRPAVTAPFPAASAAASSAPPSPADTPAAASTPLAPSRVPRTAVAAAEQLTAAWTSHARGWKATIRACGTAHLAAQLVKANQNANPATRVTGPATVTGRTSRTAHVSVPTAAGPALLTVTRDGGRWRVTSVSLAITGG